MKPTSLHLLIALLTSACVRPASTLEPEPTSSGKVRLCGMADLQTSSNANDAAGSITLGVTLINTSQSPCALKNPPQVTLIGNGQPLDAKTIQTQADTATLTIAHGENAIAILIWQNYCGEMLKDGPSIHLALTTNESLDIKNVQVVPGCDDSTQPSTLTIQPYSYPP
jgi:hypothetical protein